MNLIIKNLIKKIGYKFKLKNLFSNIYDIITIIAVVIAEGFGIAWYILRDNEKSVILLIISIVSVIIAEIATGFYSRDYNEHIKLQGNLHERLILVKAELHNHEILNIKSQHDIKNFLSLVKENYNEKFISIKNLKKTADNIVKVLMIPTVLAVISYILKDETKTTTLESKLVFSLVLLFLTIWLIIMYNMIFELIKSVIKLLNVKRSIFISDLELLSNFEIKDLDEESTEETKFIFLEREGNKMNSYNNSQFKKMVKKYCEEYGETEIDDWSDYYNKMLKILSDLKDEGKLMEEKAKTETILEYCNQYSNNENIKTSISAASVAFSVMAVIINSFSQYQTESKMKLIFLVIILSILGILTTIIMSFKSSRKLKADAVYYKSKLDLIKGIE